MCEEFGMVFDLCMFVLDHSEQSTLVQATLTVNCIVFYFLLNQILQLYFGQTLLRFLNWIPIGYVFETTLIDQLILRV
jgi:exportin-1